VVSDRLENFDGTIEIQLYHPKKGLISEKRIEVKIKANSSAIYFETEIKSILKGLKKKKAIINVQISEGNKVLSQNLFYFD
jgi:hypothetical protein